MVADGLSSVRNRKVLEPSWVRSTQVLAPSVFERQTRIYLDPSLQVALFRSPLNKPTAQSTLVTNASGTLGLTDAELDRVSAASLQIGNANSGTINVSSGITRPTSTNLEMRSGVAITLNPGSINTSGGTLVFDATSGGVQPVSAGTDVTAQQRFRLLPAMTWPFTSLGQPSTRNIVN